MSRHVTFNENNHHSTQNLPDDQERTFQIIRPEKEEAPIDRNVPANAPLSEPVSAVGPPSEPDEEEFSRMQQPTRLLLRDKSALRLSARYQADFAGLYDMLMQFLVHSRENGKLRSTRSWRPTTEIGHRPLCLDRQTETSSI